MTTWYVHRREDGSIASAHEELQLGYAEESLEEIPGSEIATWLEAARQPPVPTPAQKLAAAGLSVEDLKVILGLGV